MRGTISLVDLDLGRYVLYDQIASGGMASVHLGVIVGDAGFRRTVAIKRLHPHVAASPGALEMFIDEARLSARVCHRNIVNTLDVVHRDNELFLVMEYVHGVPVATLEQRMREQRGEPVPLAIGSAIMLDVLSGLTAIHSARDEAGQSLAIVHRDVSPQNILVGVDGTARVLDFGIAKAAVRLHTTRDDRLKGKLHYMAPEQFLDEEVDARTDQFAAGVVLWGLLTGRRLFEATNEAAIVARVLEGIIQPPSHHVPSIPAAIDELVMRALGRKKEDRFESCEELSSALRRAQSPASPDEVQAWVTSLCGDILDARATILARAETGSTTTTSEIASAAAAPASIATSTLTVTAPTFATEVEDLTATKMKSPRRRQLVFGAVGVAAAFALAAGTLWTLSSYKARASAASPVATATATTMTPATTASIPTPETTPPTTTPASAIVATSPKPPNTRAATRPSPGPKKPQCTPPYTTDSNGIQRVKPECL